MVWWGGTARADPVKNARKETLDCENCNNHSMHVLHKAKTGVGFGNPITGKLWASTRTEWALICSICNSAIMVTKEIAQELQQSFSATKIVTDTTSNQKCNACNSEINEGARFCGQCGASTS